MSGQNTSSAVMAQRKEPHDSLDYFPTPPWATRALCEHVLGGRQALKDATVLEPACGAGDMARPLSEYFAKADASDIHNYGYGDIDDFLFPGNSRVGYDWVITNPPFRLAKEFVETGLDVACSGVAVLVRTAFLEGQQRYKELFSVRPPTVVAQFVERVAMVKGRVDPKASSATAYCWLVWKKRQPVPSPPTFIWISPCRRQLEKPEDYEQPDMFVEPPKKVKQEKTL